MNRIDVCNGDADGLFALVQLRLAQPAPQATLLTGLKHDIELLQRVEAGPGDQVTVCDLSMRRNADALERLLRSGVEVRYFDHHETGEVPDHPGLEAHIDLSPETCTSLIVDRWLGGRHSRWAAAAAWGDNLSASAMRLADRLGLPTQERAALRELGEAVNYNAYGEQPEDCLLPPAALFALLLRHTDPLEAWAAEAILSEMAERRRQDLSRAWAAAPTLVDAQVRLWVLPEADWVRRVLGPFANQLVDDDPSRAHAVARARADGSFDISVRAPRSHRSGADRLCRAFGGGGRSAAAAIDRLAGADFERFVRAFSQHPWAEDGAAAAR